MLMIGVPLAVSTGLLIAYLLNMRNKAAERKRWHVVPLEYKLASPGVGDTCKVCVRFVPATRYRDCQNLWYHENEPRLHLCRECVYRICGVKIKETTWVDVFIDKNNRRIDEYRGTPDQIYFTNLANDGLLPRFLLWLNNFFYGIQRTKKAQ
jgi:hypothetical protein